MLFQTSNISCRETVSSGFRVWFVSRASHMFGRFSSMSGEGQNETTTTTFPKGGVTL